MGSVTEETATQNLQFEFRHPQLGHIIGQQRGSDIVQFRGLPFASIPGRFRQSVLRKELPHQPFLATNPGPTCPQVNQPYWPYWEGTLPDGFPVLDLPKSDELQCLNLSLTIPKRSINNEAHKTPVLVFIHGGAFVGGSHAIQLHGREVFDGMDLVRNSIQIGKDIIVVGINYRVGPLGFLASQELIEYNQMHGEAIGNYGLHDQRRALDWLSQFVAGFGGDPDNITIQGTSAGAASCHYQCIMSKPKFKRAILASGTMFGIGALPLVAHQRLFAQVAEKVATGLHADKVLDRLLSCDTQEIIDSMPWEVCHPLIISDIRDPSTDAFDQDYNPLDIMVGAAAFEEELCEGLLKGSSTSQAKSDEEATETLKSMFQSTPMLASPETFPYNCASVIESFGLREVINTPTQGIKLWAHLTGLFMFDLSSLYTCLVAQKTRKKGRAWLFRCAATNPYPASHSECKAHHGVNDLFLFNVAPELVPIQRQSSWNAGVKQIQRSWIDFTHGESPWPPVRPESSAEATGAIGPIFDFLDDGESRLYDSLEECVGTELKNQYHVLLGATRLMMEDNASPE